MRVIIVDDDFSVREGLGDILEEKGYEVVKVEKGLEALERIKNEKFDFAIIDLKLPDISGEKLISKIKNLIPEEKIIIITGYVTEEIVRKALKGMKSYFLFKPADPNQIINIIEREK